MNEKMHTERQTVSSTTLGKDKLFFDGLLAPGEVAADDRTRR